jgi:hypothetical protein
MSIPTAVGYVAFLTNCARLCDRRSVLGCGQTRSFGPHKGDDPPEASSGFALAATAAGFVADEAAWPPPGQSGRRLIHIKAGAAHRSRTSPESGATAQASF